jgi:YfiH family protein
MMFDMTNEMILPPPPAHFVWRGTPAGPALVAPVLERFADHLFTTRHWKLGQPATDGDDREAWQQVADAAGVGLDELVRVNQIHGAAAVVATRGAQRTTGDVILNADPSLAVAVQTADCVPLLLADRRTGAVAAAHAGWRGMAARVPEATMASMAAAFGTRPADLVCVVGPSIGACCYEVGVDVREAFGLAGFHPAQVDRWFSPSPKRFAANPPMQRLRAQGRPDHWFFDGWRSVRDQLEAAGVRSDQIVSSDLCTASHPGTLCSYRRDGSPAGRMAGVIKPRSRP